jgi:TonB family protein
MSIASQTPAPLTLPKANSPSTDPVAQTLALIQPWIDYVPPRQRRLGLFIFLALLAHITAFFFISIDTTRAELTHQLRPHVTVDSPQTAEVSGQQSGDEFWDRLNDPRVFLFPQPASTETSSDNPALDLAAIDTGFGASDLPPTAPPEGFQFVHPVNPPLDQQAEEAMNPPRQPFSYSENPPAIASKTTWQWDGTLAAHAPVILPDLPSPVSDTDLNPTQMRIAVGPSGTVEHALVEQSCGNTDLDQQAVLAAQKIRFASTDQSGLLWGRITVFWHYSAKPREEVVPTPPSAP